jgi:hypothetical protein
MWHAAAPIGMCVSFSFPLQERINRVSGLAHSVKRKLELLDKSNEAAQKVRSQTARLGFAA